MSFGVFVQALSIFAWLQIVAHSNASCNWAGGGFMLGLSCLQCLFRGKVHLSAPYSSSSWKKSIVGIAEPPQSRRPLLPIFPSPTMVIMRLNSVPVALLVAQEDSVLLCAESLHHPYTHLPPGPCLKCHSPTISIIETKTIDNGTTSKLLMGNNLMLS